jgi:hypothetical protein
MRPRLALYAGFTLFLGLVGCSDDRAPATAPTWIPPLELTANRTVSLDPGHTYQFAFTCANAASGSMVSITTATNIPRINVTCNSATELGAAYGTAFNEFGYEISLGSPSVKDCGQAGVTTTGTYRCKAQKYSATLTVTDEGILTPP